MADISQSLLEGERIYLDHDAVSFVGQALSSLHPGMVKFLNLLNAGKQPIIGVHLKAK